MLNRASRGCLALGSALLVLGALSGCTTVVTGEGSPASYAGGPVRLAVPILFRPVTGIATPVAPDECPVDPLARAQDPTSAPDVDDELCYPLGPAVLEVGAVADLGVVDAVSGPGMQLSLLDADAEGFAEYSTENVGKQVAFVADGVVLVAPVIQAGITGSILIAGDFDREELEELIDTLVDG